MQRPGQPVRYNHKSGGSKMSNAIVFRAKDIEKKRNFEIARDRREKRPLR